MSEFMRLFISGFCIGFAVMTVAGIGLLVYWLDRTADDVPGGPDDGPSEWYGWKDGHWTEELESE